MRHLYAWHNWQFSVIDCCDRQHRRPALIQRYFSSASHWGILILPWGLAKSHVKEASVVCMLSPRLCSPGEGRGYCSLGVHLVLITCVGLLRGEYGTGLSPLFALSCVYHWTIRQLFFQIHWFWYGQSISKR